MTEATRKNQEGKRRKYSQRNTAHLRKV